MQTFLFIVAIASIVGAVMICKLMKEVYQRQLELSKLNESQLQEQLAQQQAIASGQNTRTGLEKLQQFAQALQIQLEEVESSDEHYKIFNFSYQGDYFTIWASTGNDSIHLRTGEFASYPGTLDTYWSILRYCYYYTCDHGYVKVRQLIKDIDNDQKVIDLHLMYDLMGVTLQGFHSILDRTFVIRREITQELDKILADLQTELNDEQPTATEESVDMHEIARQMTVEKSKEQMKENDNNNDDNWTY